ncbi:MAG: protein-glutamate O-methyltransferase CheR [Thermodesulfobacteriota bacterium]
MPLFSSPGDGQARERESLFSPDSVLRIPELTEREFQDFCQLIRQHAGIHLTTQKKELVRARLMKIMRTRGLVSFQQYYRQVLEDRSGAELTLLLDAISTNQTAFWREPTHFLYLAKEVLPLWVKQLRGNPRWRFWSAGCSSGEEPYTLAMVLQDALPGHDLSGVKIYASDISTQMLAQAQRGVYPLARVEPLSPEWRRRFFQKGVNRWEGFVRVKPELRAMMQFFRLNFMESFSFNQEFDLIFCRNVMIYFEKSTQAELVAKFYKCLRPGGYLFIGHSESLCNISHRFIYVKPTIYRK